MTSSAAAFDEVTISANTLESLEREFEDVIKELGGEDNLERFRLEYEKLHRALKKSHESEKRLIKKCQGLNQEIMANAAKVQGALKMSQEDFNTIESLKKEIEKAWKMVDSAHEKEARAKETIQQLKKEVSTLSHLLEQGASLTTSQEVSLAELTEAKRELIKDCEAFNQKIVQKVTEIRDNAETVKRLEVDSTQREEELARLNEKIAHVRRELEQETRKRERAEGQIKELTSVLQTRNNEYELRKAALKQKTEAVEALEKNLKDELLQKQNLAARYEKNTRDLAQSRTAMAGEVELTTQYAGQIQQLKAELEERTTEIQQAHYSHQKLVKVQDTKHKLISKATQERDDIIKEHEMLQRQIVNLQKQIEGEKHDAESRAKVVQGLKDDQALIELQAKREQTKQENIRAQIKDEVERRAELEHELEVNRSANYEQRKNVLELEAEREKFAGMASDANVKFQKALEEVKIAQMKGEDLQKQIEEAQKRLNVQQTMYEQVRADRNLYSKNLIEAQDEISEMKRKFKIMEHQIDQLKEELSMKEKKHFESVTHHKIDSEKLQKLLKETNELTVEFEAAKARSESYTQDIKQLTKIIDGCDQALSNQQQLFLSMTNERDILGTQLVRRNDELALLYEKVRIQQSTLSKGEVMYRDRLVDIGMLRLKIAELKRLVHMSQGRVKSLEELKLQIVVLQRQLVVERTKVQALAEELENPQNLVRWRNLQGADPKEAEMEKKIQMLQKRLIQKTEEEVEKEIIVQEKEKLYIELKNILARQPGPEVAEQLNVFQTSLRKRNHHMKCVAGELNMTSTQTAEYKYEVERLNRELQEVKKQYFELKMNNESLINERGSFKPANTV